jgi:hypothetical protein
MLNINQSINQSIIPDEYDADYVVIEMIIFFSAYISKR